jgi:hypothetical protein
MVRRLTWTGSERQDDPAGSGLLINHDIAGVHGSKPFIGCDAPLFLAIHWNAETPAANRVNLGCNLVRLYFRHSIAQVNDSTFGRLLKSGDWI